MSEQQVIVIGGGLSGLAAAHTLLDEGHKVCLIDRNAFLGGNSTKATSGMNGGGTRTQVKQGVEDSAQKFYEDTVRSATGIKKGNLPEDAWYSLGKVLTYESADAVHWIQDKFGLALDVVSRLGGHTNPRTHRSKSGGKFPGMEITYALMEEFEELAKTDPSRAKLITRARVHKLVTDSQGAVVGVQYENKGKTETEPCVSCVIATGGYGAGVLDPQSLLRKVRPDLYDMNLPTTNGSHCTGDGIMMAQDIGAGVIDIEAVQVHPTGLVNPKLPNERTLFLAAEALRGEGGILLTKDGERFCNDLGTRDYVSGKMWETDKPPYRLVLNSECAKNIAWHCSHYVGRGVMKEYHSGEELARDMGIQPSQLEKTFSAYNEMHRKDNDPWGKPASFYRGVPWKMQDSFFVAIVTPVCHYTMGGLLIDDAAAVLRDSDKKPIPGLFAAGEVTGGVHGRNRLGGSALLECVVFGRKAGSSVANYLKDKVKPQSAGANVIISIPQPDGSTITVTISSSGAVSTPVAAPASTPAKPQPAPAQQQQQSKAIAFEELAKHKSEDDCWVAVNGQVLDVTEFMHDHPGGKMAIMTFAGKDATEEFNMVHDKNVVEKYASEYIVGTLAPASKM